MLCGLGPATRPDDLGYVSGEAWFCHDGDLPGMAADLMTLERIVANAAATFPSNQWAHPETTKAVGAGVADYWLRHARFCRRSHARLVRSIGLGRASSRCATNNRLCGWRACGCFPSLL